MCLGIPSKIISIDGDSAIVSVGGTEVEASLQLLNDVKVGDFVLLHTGFAIEKISDAEAKETLEILKKLSYINDDKSSLRSAVVSAFAFFAIYLLLKNGGSCYLPPCFYLLNISSNAASESGTDVAAFCLTVADFDSVGFGATVSVEDSEEVVPSEGVRYSLRTSFNSS